MIVRMRFNIPAECNKWLKNFDNSRGTRKDWQAIIENLFTAFLQDIQSDYNQKENE